MLEEFEKIIEEFPHLEAAAEAMEMVSCSCGSPEDVWETILTILNMLNSGNRKKLYDTSDYQSGLTQIALYAMENAGLVEHGGSVFGSWPTKLGEEVIELLEKL